MRSLATHCPRASHRCRVQPRLDEHPVHTEKKPCSPRSSRRSTWGLGITPPSRSARSTPRGEARVFAVACGAQVHPPPARKSQGALEEPAPDGPRPRESLVHRVERRREAPASGRCVPSAAAQRRWLTRAMSSSAGHHRPLRLRGRAVRGPSGSGATRAPHRTAMRAARHLRPPSRSPRRPWDEPPADRLGQRVEPQRVLARRGLPHAGLKLLLGVDAIQTRAVIGSLAQRLAPRAAGARAREPLVGGALRRPRAGGEIH